MRQINEFFELPPSISLYHYTGIGALLGIEKSKSLWASCIYFLNDGEEIIYAQRIFSELVESRINESNETEANFLSQFLEWSKPFNNLPYNIFIFSLSEEPSLLSQWRSYTPHGKGISIGFSPMVIEKIIKENNLIIAKCRYERHEHDEILNVLLERMLHTFRNYDFTQDKTKYAPGQEYYKFLEQFRGDVLQVFSTIKHPAFKEEKEWRLISKYFESYAIPEIKYREGASMLVPYTEFKIERWHKKKEFARDVYFERVILGPSQHYNLSFHALSNFLSNKQISNITEGTTVPYREWQ